jgi:hypothetical protein
LLSYLLPAIAGIKGRYIKVKVELENKIEIDDGG